VRHEIDKHENLLHDSILRPLSKLWRLLSRRHMIDQRFVPDRGRFKTLVGLRVQPSYFRRSTTSRVDMGQSDTPTFSTELQTANVVHSGGGNVNYFAGGSFAPQATVPVNGSNLPHPHPHFVGREEELGKIFGALSSRAWIVTIDGMGGIGKTTLALEVAHRCKKGGLLEYGSSGFERFIWTSARDKSNYTLDDLIDSVLSVLGPMMLAGQRSDSENKIALTSRLLSGSACLLIVDNLESVTDEPLHRFLRDLPSPSKVLVTSRHHIQTGERVITVGGLEERDAVELLKHEARRLQIELGEGDHQQLKIISRKTYGIPLVLRWVMESVYNGKTIEWVMGALQAATAKDLFDYIYRLSLSTLDDATRQVFRSLAIFPGWAELDLITMVNPEHSAVEERVSTLVTRSLLEDNRVLVQSNRRFRLHPFTRYLAVHEIASTADKGEAIVTLALEYYQERLRTRAKVVADEWENIEGISHLALDFGNEKLFRKAIKLAVSIVGFDPTKSERLIVKAIQSAVLSGRADLKIMLLQEVGDRYVYGLPVTPPSFYGREKLLHTIRSTFEGSHRSYSLISLVGPDKIGKTSILLTLAKCEQNSCIYVPVDLQILLGGAVAEFSFAVMSSLHSYLEFIGIRTTLPRLDRSLSGHETLLFLEGYIETIRKSVGGKHIVLMLDEFDSLRPSASRTGDHFLRIPQFLRYMLQKGLIGIITAGLHSPAEWAPDGPPSPLANIGITLRVTGFDFEEACESLRRPMQGLIEFDPQALRYIYDMTGGAPFLLQLIGGTITGIGVEREVLRVDYALAEFAIQQLLDKHDFFIQHLFQNLGPSAKQVVLAAAELSDNYVTWFTPEQIAAELRIRGVHMFGEQLDQIVQSLVASAIFKTGADARYSYVMGIFAAHLRRVVWSERPQPRKNTPTGDKMEHQSDGPSEDATYRTSIGSVTGQVHTGSGDIHVGGFIAGAPILSRTDLATALREFTVQIDRSRQHGLADDIADDIATEIDAARREAEKDYPKADRLVLRLESAKNLLGAGAGTAQAASGAASAAGNLLSVLQGWIQHIPSLFGG
jgi:AAA+ ATPase superfamily predicted ATPase